MRDAIQKENVEIPGGTHRTGRLGGRTPDARPHRRDRASSRTSSSRPWTARRSESPTSATPRTRSRRPASALFLDDGSPAVQLDIRRASGENTIKVTEAIKARLRPIRQTLPAGVSLTLTTDDSRFIYASISSLEEHLVWGSLLAALVVVFFIRNIRAVIISALAIPASIVATFTLMRGMDFTLNNMTLLGLTLAVGIVIDDAIVVLENIFRYIEEKHCPPFEAAIQGTREVALPVMATTLSLVVIFLPVAFMTGYARALHLPVRVDDGVRDHRVDDRQLHADADAQLAFPEAGRRRARHQDQGPRLLPLDRPGLRQIARVVAGASDDHPRHHRGRCSPSPSR